MADFDTIQDAKNELVLADLHLAVLFAPTTTAALSTIEDPSTGDIVSLTGYKSAGIMEKSAGVSITNDVESTDIEGYGFAEPVRTIINKRNTTFQATFLETNITVLEKYWGTTFSNIVPSTHGGVVLEAPSLPKNTYYRCILLGQDDVDDDPLYTYYLMPRVKLESVDNQELRDDGAVSYTLTFQAFRDSTVGYSVAQGWCGPGWTHLVSRAGFVAAPASLTAAAVTGDLSVTAMAGMDHTVQLKVTGDNGINYTPLVYNWVSATPATCTVSQTGLVTGVAAGGPINVTGKYTPAGGSELTVTAAITVT